MVGVLTALIVPYVYIAGKFAGIAERREGKLGKWLSYHYFDEYAIVWPVWIIVLIFIFFIEIMRRPFVAIYEWARDK